MRHKGGLRSEQDRKDQFFQMLQFSFMKNPVLDVARSDEKAYQLCVHIKHLCSQMTSLRFAFFTEEVEKATTIKVSEILTNGLLKPVMDRDHTPSKEEFFALFIEKLKEHKFVFIDYHHLRHI